MLWLLAAGAVLAATPTDTTPTEPPPPTVTVPIEEPPPSPTVVLPDLPADPAPPSAAPPIAPETPRHGAEIARRGGRPSTTPHAPPEQTTPRDTPEPTRPRERRAEPQQDAEPEPEQEQEPERTTRTAQREEAPDAKSLAALTAALKLGPAAGEDVARYAQRLAARAASSHPVAVRKARSASTAAPDDGAGTFLPPVASRNEASRSGSTDAVPPAGLVIILAGCLVLLATLVPARAWAATGIDHPDQARATTMLLGVGSMLVGLVVLFAS